MESYHVAGDNGCGGVVARVCFALKAIEQLGLRTWASAVDVLSPIPTYILEKIWGCRGLADEGCSEYDTPALALQSIE